MEVPQTHSNQPHRPSNPPQIDQALIGIINIIHTQTTFLKERGESRRVCYWLLSAIKTKLANWQITNDTRCQLYGEALKTLGHI